MQTYDNLREKLRLKSTGVKKAKTADGTPAAPAVNDAPLLDLLFANRPFTLDLAIGMLEYVPYWQITALCVNKRSSEIICDSSVFWRAVLSKQYGLDYQDKSKMRFRSQLSIDLNYEHGQNLFSDKDESTIVKRLHYIANAFRNGVERDTEQAIFADGLVSIFYLERRITSVTAWFSEQFDKETQPPQSLSNFEKFVTNRAVNTDTHYFVESGNTLTVRELSTDSVFCETTLPPRTSPLGNGPNYFLFIVTHKSEPAALIFTATAGDYQLVPAGANSPLLSGEIYDTASVEIVFDEDSGEFLEVASQPHQLTNLPWTEEDDFFHSVLHFPPSSPYTASSDIQWQTENWIGLIGTDPAEESALVVQIPATGTVIANRGRFQFETDDILDLTTVRFAPLQRQFRTGYFASTPSILATNGRLLTSVEKSQRQLFADITVPELRVILRAMVNAAEDDDTVSLSPTEIVGLLSRGRNELYEILTEPQTIKSYLFTKAQRYFLPLVV